MHNDYSTYVNRASLLAIIIAVILIVGKGIAWWKTGSVSILSSLTDSLLDFLSSFTNMLILRFALMPADDDHSFGHGKAESLAALAQSAFISGSAIFLLLNGIERLNNPQPLEKTGFGIVVIVLSIIITLILISYQQKVIDKTGSPAIKADRLHYKTDLLTNIAVLIAILLSIYNFQEADAFFAIMIAIYIIISAAKMFMDAIHLLLDKALPQEEIDLIIKIAMEHPNIIGIHDVKTRRSGAVRFIQLHLELDDNLLFFKAHEITDGLEKKLLNAFPMSDIIIHQEPTTIVIGEGKHGYRI